MTTYQMVLWMIGVSLLMVVLSEIANRSFKKGNFGSFILAVLVAANFLRWLFSVYE